MKIALAQHRAVAGSVSQNLLSVTGAAKRAAAAGCRLVVFPELSDTGYEVNAICSAASSWDEGPLAEIQAVAKASRIWIAIGLTENTPEGLFNSLAVVAPDGSLAARYRKSHLITVPAIDERAVFRPGNSVEWVQIEEWKFGLSICFDLRFPELYRKLCLAGVDGALTVAAWPMSRREHWLTLLKARAIENQFFVLGVNRVGIDGSIEFAGNSVAYDPSGTELCRGHGSDPELLELTLERRLVQQTRDSLPVLNCIRDDL